MEIDFCGPVILATDGGISYRAKVDGETIACRITMEVLQDIDSENRHSDPMAQFKAHQGTLLSIAEKKIRNGHVKDNQVWVLTEDMQP